MVILLIQSSYYCMRTLLRFLVIAELGGDTLLLSFQFCHLFGDFCKPPVGFITTGIQFQKLIEFAVSSSILRFTSPRVIALPLEGTASCSKASVICVTTSSLGGIFVFNAAIIVF